MADPRRPVISSAVATVLPDRRDGVVDAIRAMPGVEVAAAEGAKVVILIEAANRGEAGDRLTAVALLGGVVSANMVFEHVGEDEEVPT